MFKRSLLTTLFLFSVMAFVVQAWHSHSLHFGAIVFGQNAMAEPERDNDIISKFSALSTQQLLDTAEYYVNKSCNDIALICYSLIINTVARDADVEQQKRVIEAYNKAAVLNYYMCDFRTAYELLIKGLLLCERTDYFAYQTRILTNIGIIYFRFNKYDIAKSYYLKALQLCQDITVVEVILNNLGETELQSGNMDSAYYYLSKALQYSRQNKAFDMHNILNTMALFYEKNKQFDSAFYYYRLSLEVSTKNNKIETKAESLSNLGNLFFKTGKKDSAIYYINLSNVIAEENNLPRILIENYLILSQIEESKGYTVKAFNYFKKHASLRDSVFNVEKFADINQLQRLYEVSKTNQQIEQLTIEQRVNERTIYYQGIIQSITFGILVSVIIILLFIYFQNRRLKTAYKVLFEKNMEIFDYQKHSKETYLEKYKKSALKHDMHDELLSKILTLMEDVTIVCNIHFSVDKLAELVQSNQKYVSQVINTAFKKSFRPFVNSYRIREAQRIFSEPDALKYSIESIALRVGFKSRNAFDGAFKEITGVSPSFYLKSMQEQSTL